MYNILQILKRYFESTNIYIIMIVLNMYFTVKHITNPIKLWIHIIKYNNYEQIYSSVRWTSCSFISNF